MMGFDHLFSVAEERKSNANKAGVNFFFLASDTSRICFKYVFPSGPGRQMHKLH